MKVVFFGTGDISLPSLRWLINEPGIDVRAVVTRSDKPAFRSLRLHAPETKRLALEANIPVFQPKKLREIEDDLRHCKADIFVVMAYGKILPKWMLDIPRLGCLNLHASLLPRHRGAAPVQAAILAGDAETGITVMWMNEGLDTGDIFLSEKIGIAPADTGGTLHNRLARLAPFALASAVAALLSKEAPRTPQDHALATYAPKLAKNDGEIDWKLDAETIERRIRAYSPWPGSFTTLLDDTRLIIHRAEAHPAHSDTVDMSPGTILEARKSILRVATGAGEIHVRHLQRQGGKKLDTVDFLNGNPIIPEQHEYYFRREIYLERITR